jgi:hypothetical protein
MWEKLFKIVGKQMSKTDIVEYLDNISIKVKVTENGYIVDNGTEYYLYVENNKIDFLWKVRVS